MQSRSTKEQYQNVMCHQPMKFPDMFHQNPPCTFDKIREKPNRMEKALTACLESKGQGHSKN